MRVAFRLDASAEIGTGHFMRCLTLANELQGRGARVTFANCRLPELLVGVAERAGHEVVQPRMPRIDPPDKDLFHSSWLGNSQAADAANTIDVLTGHVWDWLVVDHYALDARWETAVRAAAHRILAIDDLADRTHDCDVLLDQNLHSATASRYAGRVPSHARLLLGPRYALLREAFAKLRSERNRDGGVQRVLVYFGGADQANYTATAVAALARTRLRNRSADVVISSGHPFRPQIETMCAEYGYELHLDTAEMPRLMASADLAIGAGGTTTWERCCLGLPAIVFSIAENQRALVEAAAVEGAVYAPEGVHDTGSMTRHLLTLLENPRLLRAFSRRGMELVDGRGTLRVIRSLGLSTVTVREAKCSDAQAIYEWRNHPSVRSVSRDSSVIERANHDEWFAKVLGDSERFLLIGSRAGAPAGVVRFDVRGSEAEVSIFTVPGHSRAGVGVDLLLAAEEWLAKNRVDVLRVTAEVLGGNETSHHLFLAAGYRTHSAHYEKRIEPLWQ